MQKYIYFQWPVNYLKIHEFQIEVDLNEFSVLNICYAGKDIT